MRGILFSLSLWNTADCIFIRDLPDRFQLGMSLLKRLKKPTNGLFWRIRSERNVRIHQEMYRNWIGWDHIWDVSTICVNHSHRNRETISSNYNYVIIFWVTIMQIYWVWNRKIYILENWEKFWIILVNWYFSWN